MSTVIFGECETNLKAHYKIGENKTLIIFKIDYYIKDSLIPIVGYEIFHPDTMERLNLSLCNQSQINISIPISIDEDNLMKYDPNSEYYTDQCNSYTTKNSTYILLNDRYDEYNTNNMSIRENDCYFVEYKSDSKKSIFKCNIKVQQIDISE